MPADTKKKKAKDGKKGDDDDDEKKEEDDIYDDEMSEEEERVVKMNANTVSIPLGLLTVAAMITVAAVPLGFRLIHTTCV